MELLVDIIDNCLNNEYFPNIWKLSKIFPLVEKPNDYDINNARPISMSSNIGKLFERIIRLELDNTLNLSGIPIYQFDFKPGHSSIDALTVCSDSLFVKRFYCLEAILKIFVQINDTRSDTGNIYCGVPQGQYWPHYYIAP